MKKYRVKEWISPRGRLWYVVERKFLGIWWKCDGFLYKYRALEAAKILASGKEPNVIWESHPKLRENANEV